MEFVIDRFEGEIAVLEDENGNLSEIKKSLLPQNAKESDCLILKDGKYTVSKEKTESLKQEIDDLMEDLFV